MNKEEKNINNNPIETPSTKERTLDIFEANKNRKNYSFVQNSKEILEPRIPSQNDLEKFEEWKKKKREDTSNEIGKYFFIVIVCIFAVVSLILNIHSWSIIFYISPLVVLTLIPCLALYGCIKEYVDIPSWEIEHCNYVQIVDKYTVWSKNITKYLIISINEKHLQFIDDFNYSSVNIGDEVMLFSVKGQKNVYFYKKD
ncbi:MAG: hypothetical protein IJX99_04985 [Clostridia bacterium]|nr:hypothetical protein [Clostridia bacterium]